MSPFLQAVIDGSLELIVTIESRDRALYDRHSSGFGGDVSLGVDLISEQIFSRHLSKFGAIFSEESGWIGENNGSVIYIDPLDGSDNFISNIPYFGMSVALEQEGKITEAAILNLANRDIFLKNSDFSGSYKLYDKLVENEIFISDTPPVGIFEKAYEHPYLAGKLREAGFKFRSPGAIALSLSYAPYVKYLLFLGTMRPYDIVAGLYLNEHLYVEKNDKYILISSDLEVFETINDIVKRSLLESI